MNDSGSCTVQGCGRILYARELCQSHHRQLMATGELREIRPYRRRRSPGPTVKFSGLRLTRGCAAVIERYAQAQGLSKSAVIIDVLEDWFVSGARRPRPPHEDTKP